MSEPLHSIAQVQGVSIEHFELAMIQDARPKVFRGLVNNWPVVSAAKAGDEQLAACLQHYAVDEPVTVYQAPAEADGRIFYNQDMTGFNFRPDRMPLRQFLTSLLNARHQVDAETLYLGSTLVDKWLPGLKRDHAMPLTDVAPLTSLWLGNRSRVAAHFDFPDNLACVIAGTRKFTLFPPEQLPNLYIGPLDFTPAGQAISLVDAQAPDPEKFPRFHIAMQHALEVELQAGDAIYIPSMWWHQVQGLSAVNGLINFWWRSSPAFLGNPFDALRHALLAIGQLPDQQRQAWKHLFDQYVFDKPALTHIPEHAQGVLGEIDQTAARQLRADLLNKLNR
ncbi:cupin-like domain-containing protein [Bowmanella denitrificans]|uniref:cupin-like domain-containing protein n=1 Tax=Bowmanella denitrificans TaxID=366582 RepID=UPI001C0EE161|nr:cupin-like domain-containing protein [Bowmanella denitrificans]